ncbi:MAG: cytochrome c biogenesis protein DipZ [Acidimicrobiales bacterium]
MILLLGVGFVGGLITGISPCILPVVPVIVAGGATGRSRWRPYLVIAGLVVSFSVFTLVGGSLLSLAHLPQDLLRDAGIAVLIALGIGLMVPKVGELLERPFARLGARRQSHTKSGFLLGVSLGLVFVPCAGPVLAAISVVAATHHVGIGSVLLTVAYAIGAAIPLLVLAVLSQEAAVGVKAFRAHALVVRRVGGAILSLTGLAIALNLTAGLQTALPGYTSALENHVETGSAVTRQLHSITGSKTKSFSDTSVSKDPSLPDLGPAPAFTGITTWLNTPGGKPLSLAQLRGKVVLVDFWTYSCINCQRALPHVEAWYSDYKADGLVVVGVHTPEFAFEHVVSNVAAAAARLGVHYPVAIDNSYGTWNAYGNQYWPADYLIGPNGHIRYTAFGEGGYAGVEQAIRTLLSSNGATHLPAPTGVPDRTPTDSTTPESYLGYDRLANYVGVPVVHNRAKLYKFPASLPANDLSLSGTWTVGPQSATAGARAAIRLSFTARDVYLVLGGQGKVTVSVGGKQLKVVQVSGVPGLYTLLSAPPGPPEQGLLQLDVSPGVAAYDFTFG